MAASRAERIGAVWISRTVLGKGAPNQTTNVPDVKTNYVGLPSQANVGDYATLYTNDFNEFIVITVRYGDGSTKTIFSQQV